MPDCKGCDWKNNPRCTSCQEQADDMRGMCRHPAGEVIVFEDSRLGEVYHCKACGEEWV